MTTLDEIAETVPALHGGTPPIVDECRKRLPPVDLATFDAWLADPKMRPQTIVRRMKIYAEGRDDFPVPSVSSIKRYRKRVLWPR